MRITEELTVKTILDKLERSILKIIDEKIESNEVSTRDLIEYLEILERIYRVKSIVSKTG